MGTARCPLPRQGSPDKMHPEMGRTPKGNAPPTVVEIADKEIPGWVLEVPPPEGDQVLDVLNDARIQPGLVKGDGSPTSVYSDYFDRLAERARKEAEEGEGGDGGAAIALALLDLVPGYIEVLDRPEYGWLRDRLSYVFNFRRYAIFEGIKKSVGAPKSSGPRAAHVDHLVRKGMKVGKAIQEVAKHYRTSVDAIEKELERERKKAAAREERVAASHARLGLVDDPKASKVSLMLPAQKPGGSKD